MKIIKKNNKIDLMDYLNNRFIIVSLDYVFDDKFKIVRFLNLFKQETPNFYGYLLLFKSNHEINFMKISNKEINTLLNLNNIKYFNFSNFIEKFNF